MNNAKTTCWFYWGMVTKEYKTKASELLNQEYLVWHDGGVA